MKILAIMKRELQSFFFSPIAYIVYAAFMTIVGYLFWIVLATNKLATLEPMLYNAAFILMLASPVLTMKLISEEKKSKTIELLLTSPISPTEIVLGKFMAALVVYIILIGLTLQYPLIMNYYAPKLDWGPIISGYTGLFLMACAFISVGICASSITENQIIAAIITFGGLILGWAKFAFDNPFGASISKLSLFDRYSDFLRGIIDSGNVIFFLTFTIVWLFIATRIIDSDSWR